MRSYWISLIAFACVYISQGDFGNAFAVSFLGPKIVYNGFDRYTMNSVRERLA